MTVIQKRCSSGLRPKGKRFVLKTEVAWTSEAFVSYHPTSWRSNPEDHDLKFNRDFTLQRLVMWSS
jgi:hypothetical protein